MGVDLISWRCRIRYFLCKILSCSAKYTISSLQVLKAKFLKSIFGNIYYFVLYCFLFVDMLKKTQALQQLCFLYKEIPIKDKICLVLIHVHGKHCVPCCLSFFLQTLQNPIKSKVWSANDVDNVLIVGNYLYKCSVDAMGRQHDYFLIRDLPNYLT